MNNYGRQTDLFNAEAYKDIEVTIVGCGAIGSFTALALAKMGLSKFSIWDFDYIEDHNLPNQFFKEADLGSKKVEVTAQMIKEYNSGAEVVTHGKFVNEFIESPIVVCAVDSMEFRKQVFNGCKGKVQLFLDSRMGALQGQIYSIDMADKKEVKFYESTLFSDDDAAPEVCTAKSIIFTVLGMSSLICNQVKKALTGEKIGKEMTNYIVIDYLLPQIM